jgi:hypothetical protein
MKRHQFLILALLVVLASVIGGIAATNSVLFGSGNGDSSFTFDTVAKAVSAQSVVANGPAAQTIGSGGTIAADACGGLKVVTAAGAVNTDTTNPFTAPAAGNQGCVMNVCNTGANTITIKHATLFLSTSGADVALAQNKCVPVGSTGASGVWYQLGALQADS